MQTVLLIVKPTAYSQKLEQKLAEAGLYPIVVEHFQQALLLIDQLIPLVIILSDQVSEQSPVALCRAVRSFSDRPLLMLCSANLEMRHADLLEIGADVVLPNHPSLTSLLAQLEALLRRVEWEKAKIAKQLEQENETLLNDLLFDLQAPLSVAREALEVQQALQLSDDKLQRAGWRELMRQLSKLRQAYADLFLLSQQVTPTPTAFRLDKLFEEVQEKLWPKLDRPDGTLRSFLPLGEVWLYADHSHVWRMLRHLLQNAVSFSASDTSIFLHSELVSASHVELAVIDTGEGLEKAVQTAVFQKFFKVNPDSPGLGIGLAVVQKLAQANGGLVQVESILGQGACFQLRLPLALPKQVSL